jgi:predicted ATPase
LQTTLGPALMATKGIAAPDVGRTYARARVLCRQVEDAPQVLSVLRGLWNFYLVRAEYQTAQELAEQLLTLAQRQQTPALILEAHLSLGISLFWQGGMAAARWYLEQGSALYNPQQHRAHALLYGLDPGMACRSYAALALWSLGYPDQARQCIEAALTLAQELAHPFSLAAALQYAANLYQLRREWPTAQELAEAAITLSTEQGFPQWLPWGTFMRGWALVAQRPGEEAIAQMRQGLAARLATGAEMGRSYALALLADAHGRAGRVQEGLRQLSEALAHMDTTGERPYAAEVYRLKGELLLRQAMPDEAEAETCFHQALDVARRQQAKSLELRAAMGLSRLWQRQGKCVEAQALLAPVFIWFTEGFDTADLQEAKALLEALS